MPSSRPATTVLLARFEDLVSLGLRALVEEDPALQLLAADVPHEDIDGVLGVLSPDVAVVNFGSLGAPAEVRRLHEAHPASRIVVLANHPSAAEANQVLAFGATACLSKDTEARDVRNAIHLASRGLQLLPGQLAASSPRFELPGGPEPLTPRESDVLEHLQLGRSNAEIAIHLQVGIETVRTHRRNIYRKLGVRTRRELASLSAPLSRSPLTSSLERPPC